MDPQGTKAAGEELRQNFKWVERWKGRGKVRRVGQPARDRRARVPGTGIHPQFTAPACGEGKLKVKYPFLQTAGSGRQYSGFWVVVFFPTFTCRGLHIPQNLQIGAFVG